MENIRDNQKWLDKLETAVDSRGKDNFNDVMLLDNKEVVEGYESIFSRSESK